MDGDCLVMEIEMEQAKREYAAMRLQQDREHMRTCPESVREQAKEIVSAILPARI